MWQMGSAPFIGGGFGHFYHYAPVKTLYAINRYAMETKRLLDVLDKHLGEGSKQYVCGDQYTIADMAIWPWIGWLVDGKIYGEAADSARPGVQKRVCVVQAHWRAACSEARRHGSICRSTRLTARALGQPRAGDGGEVFGRAAGFGRRRLQRVEGGEGAADQCGRQPDDQDPAAIWTFNIIQLTMVCQTQVWKAIYKPSGEDVIVKMRARNFAVGGETVWQSLLTRMLNLEGHHNVLGLKEVIQDERNYYIDVPERECKRIMREILEAVDHIHSRGLIHRDIKPENIMFHDTSNEPNSPKTPASKKAVKLIDFDTCLEYEPKSPRAKHVVGTLGRYLAPEALQGDYSPASDLWSVGVILYILMTGDMPFDQDCYRSDVFGEQLRDTRCGSATMNSIYYKLQHPLIEEMRQLLGPLEELPEDLVDDLCFCRFLRGHGNNPKEAAQYMGKAIDYRLELISRSPIKELPAGSVLPCFPVRVINGRSMNALPIIASVVRRVDFETLERYGDEARRLAELSSNSRRAVRPLGDDFLLSQLEQRWLVLHNLSKKQRRMVKFFEVRDMNGASISTLLTEGATQLSKIKNILSIVQDFYPEMIHQVAVLNSTSSFSGLFNFLSLIFNERMKAKIKEVADLMEAKAIHSFVEETCGHLCWSHLLVPSGGNEFLSRWLKQGQKLEWTAILEDGADVMVHTAFLPQDESQQEELAFIAEERKQTEYVAGRCWKRRLTSTAIPGPASHRRAICANSSWPFNQRSEKSRDKDRRERGSSLRQRPMAHVARELLKKELVTLMKDESCGFSDDSDFFTWRVVFEGPAESLYEGGIFTAILKFPSDFPNNPPEMRFETEMWHPNIYPDGRVVLAMVVMSMLVDPNVDSPANIDAAVNMKNDYEGWKKKVRQLTRKSVEG
eukprot:g16993.t1